MKLIEGRSSWMAWVVREGIIRAGDRIRLLEKKGHRHEGTKARSEGRGSEGTSEFTLLL